MNSVSKKKSLLYNNQLIVCTIELICTEQGTRKISQIPNDGTRRTCREKTLTYLPRKNADVPVGRERPLRVNVDNGAAVNHVSHGNDTKHDAQLSLTAAGRTGYLHVYTSAKRNNQLHLCKYSCLFRLLT